MLAQLIAQGFQSSAPAAGVQVLGFVVMALVLLVVFACPICGYLIGETKGRTFQGLLLGLFFGPIGVMTIGFLPAREID